MNNLIAVKLTLLFFFFYSVLFNETPTTATTVAEEEAATQVVKICHLNNQEYAVPQNCSDPRVVTLDVDENGIAIAKLDVYAANLVGSFGYFTLPPGVEAMYIEYDVPGGGFAVSSSITQFQLVQNSFPALYVASVNLVYDFSTLCDQGDPGMFASNCRLVNTNNPNIPNTAYPILNYTENNSSTPNIFSCNIFHETCALQGCATNPPQGCPATTLPAEEDAYYCINCHQYSGNGDHNGGGGPSGGYVDQSLDPQSNKVSNTITEVNPNPFQSSFIIKTSLLEKQSYEMHIFDINGKLIERITQDGVKGMNTVEVDSHQWQPGIYYAHINGLGFSKTLKLIKL